MATFDNLEVRIRAELNDDDDANPVVDPLVMLKILGDCYLNVAAVLGVSPAKNALAIAGLTEVSASASQLTAIDTLLYSDNGTADYVLPKLDYETVIRMRGGRSAAQLPESRPRAYAAREISGNTVKLYFDTKVPSDATAQLWTVAQATRPTMPKDTVFLSENGIRAVECMTIVACGKRMTKEQLAKLGIGEGLFDYSQSMVDTLLGQEKGRVAGIELPDRIVETED